MSSAQRAFDALYERHRMSLYAFLLGRTGDRDAAGDLLQETFLRVWRKFDRITALPEAEQRRVLYAIARNAATDHFRKPTQREVSLDRVADHQATEDSESSAEHRAQLQALGRAIQKLPEDLRTVLTMATVVEMSRVDIARALNRPPGTVRYQLYEARRRLECIMQSWKDNP